MICCYSLSSRYFCYFGKTFLCLNCYIFILGIQTTALLFPAQFVVVTFFQSSRDRKPHDHGSNLITTITSGTPDAHEQELGNVPIPSAGTSNPTQNPLPATSADGIIAWAQDIWMQCAPKGSKWAYDLWYMSSPTKRYSSLHVPSPSRTSEDEKTSITGLSVSTCP